MREPVGFIVEGDGEYACYPSLFVRTIKSKGFKIPIINAGGCGNVVKRMGEQLDDLMMAFSPLTVIITVDLQDILSQGLANSPEELYDLLRNSINEWIQRAENDARLRPLPNRIEAVVQVKKFESWLISDVQGLIDGGFVDANCEVIENVEIVNPIKWINDNIYQHFRDTKDPNITKAITAAICPDRMREHSSSFDCFAITSINAYDYWENYLLVGQ